MSLVVVERTFAEPVSFDELQAREDEHAGCLEIYGVTSLRSYLSRDGRRMACLYDGPDAESVRMLQERTGLPFDHVWAATAIGGRRPDPPGGALVVERLFEEPVEEGALAELDGPRALSSYLALDRRRSLSVFPVTETPRGERSWPATVHSR